MKEKYELIGYGKSAHLIRKYKKHWWNKWQIEMEGTTPKIYPVDQKHCVHDYEFIAIVFTASYPAGIPMRLWKCKKCGQKLTYPYILKHSNLIPTIDKSLRYIRYDVDKTIEEFIRRIKDQEKPSDEVGVNGFNRLRR